MPLPQSTIVKRLSYAMIWSQAQFGISLLGHFWTLTTNRCETTAIFSCDIKRSFISFTTFRKIRFTKCHALTPQNRNSKPFRIYSFSSIQTTIINWGCAPCNIEESKGRIWKSGVAIWTQMCHRGIQLTDSHTKRTQWRWPFVSRKTTRKVVE